MTTTNVNCDYCLNSEHSNEDCQYIQIGESSWLSAMIATMFLRNEIMDFTWFHITIFLHYLYGRNSMQTFRENGIINTPIEQTMNSYELINNINDNDNTTHIENHIENIMFPEDPVHIVITPTMLCMETGEELSQMEYCSICREDKVKIEFNELSCNHEFCHSCIVSYIEYIGWEHMSTCPLCRKPFDIIHIRDFDNYQEIHDKFNRASGFLKDAMVASFGNEQFVLWCQSSYTNESMIRVLLENFCDPDLRERVDNTESEEEKARMLRDYAYINAQNMMEDDDGDDEIINMMEDESEIMNNTIMIT